MATLEEWQDFLNQTMVELDKLWKLLDEVWNEAPYELAGHIYDQADRFHQAYWDVFNVAVDNQDLESLRDSTEEFLDTAGDEVAGAWQIVASYRVERSEKSLNEARGFVISPLATTHRLLHEAKKFVSTADAKRGDVDYPGATDQYKECIRKCLECNFEIDDAVRLHRGEVVRDTKEEKREEKRLQVSWKQALFAGAVIILATIFGSVVGAIITYLITVQGAK